MKSPLLYLIWSFFWIFLGCPGGEQAQNLPGDSLQENRVKSDSSYPSFTPQEHKRIQQLRETGGLRAAVIRSEDNYLPLPDGSIKGVDYNVAAFIAQELKVPLVLDVQEDLTPFYSYQGSFDPRVVTDESIIYTPDLLKTNDVYILPMSINPWRQRLSSMIPIYPVGIGIVSPRAETIKAFKDLDGLTAVVWEGSFGVQMVEAMAAEHDITINQYLIKGDVPLEEPLSMGKGDFAIDAIFAAASHISKEGPISFSPLVVQTILTGWVVKKEDTALRSILEKMIQYSFEKGKIQEAFEDTYDLSFDNYMQLIGQ